MPNKAKNQKPPSLQVLVTVSGGVADVLFKSPGKKPQLANLEIVERPKLAKVGSY